MEQVVDKDASSESIETIAPFMTIIGVDSTFVSTIRIKPQIAFLSVKVFRDLAIGRVKKTRGDCLNIVLSMLTNSSNSLLAEALQQRFQMSIKGPQD